MSEGPCDGSVVSPSLTRRDVMMRRMQLYQGNRPLISTVAFHGG
ncbi:hypothetical protein RISK_003704 [Rhodopirellula islandica]|uniref:Uncharacterized protein n=1 Tax=Rhodopirellula islandica TaxID=595434 RepID=A0A0J1BC45_RHOIS|nr:hypothetical protein RISK_003704 [Rhodopirellula islandica]